MKKTIVKICIIFLLLILYCITETLFLNSFTDKMYQMVFDLQNEGDIQKMHEIYLEMEQFIEDKEMLLDIMIPKTEIELVRVSLGRVRDHLAEGQGGAARVSAGEIIGYLSSLNGNKTLIK